MKQDNYHLSVQVGCSPEEAFEKISKVSQWWAAHFDGSAEKLNDTFTVHFGETFVTFKVTEFIPGRRIAWLVIDCELHWLRDKKEWQGTSIVWDISSGSDMTQVDFTHIGLVPGIECYNDCIKGWSFYVSESLFKLITQGKGMPETPKTARA